MRSSQLYDRRLHGLILVLITLMAWWLRLYRLDAQSLWYDEGVTAEIAQRNLVELTRWTARDIQPPLYYYIVAAWGQLTNWMEWNLRFPSVAWGVLSIPLMATLAIRLTRNHLAGLIAAFLTALHPLLLYYSQEARMYAMLTTLGILSGYLLLRCIDHNRSSQRLTGWVAYVVVATAAIYTHYFAFFLLLALGIALLTNQFLNHKSICSTALIRPFFLANIAILVLYLPWFTTLFTRLTIDASYWQGQLKTWEALRQIAISFSSGETLYESDAIYFLMPCLVGTLLAWTGIIFLKPKSQKSPNDVRQIILYTVLWGSIPVIAILLLASLVPKFNARYVMIALPGLIVLWSAGIAFWFTGIRYWILDISMRDRPLNIQYLISNIFYLGSVFIATGLFLFLSALFIWSDYNWFTEPNFKKDQWRELSFHIRQKFDEGQVVVLTSGHTWPIWNYYSDDLPVTNIPDIEILDVNAVLDFAQSAHLLQEALADRTGAWLVYWQDEVVDPMGTVRAHLQLAAREKRDTEQFWGLEFHRFKDLNLASIGVTPPGFVETNINFGNQLILLGYTVDLGIYDNDEDEEVEIGADGDLFLLWQVHPDAQLPLLDYSLVGETLTETGQPYARLNDRRVAGYNFPTTRWQPGQIYLSHIPGEEWAGARAVPGNYSLQLRVYSFPQDFQSASSSTHNELDVIDGQGQWVGNRAILNLTLPAPTLSFSRDLNKQISALP